MSAALPLQATVRLTLRTPFISKSTSIPHHGLDAVLARSADGQHLVLAGSLLAGRLRHLAQSVVATLGKDDADAKPVMQLLHALGREAESQSLAPNAGALDFTDLTAPLPTDATTAVRIAIDADKGAATHGALLLMEQAAASGADICFAGKLKLHCSLAEAQAHCKTLRALTPLIDTIGALQGVGFGRIVSATVGEPEPYAPAATFAAPANAQHLRLTLSFDEAFCFAGKRAGDNLFTSLDHVPGAAIKGAIARAWLRLRGSTARSIASAGPDLDPARQALAKAFDSLVITQARRCTADGQRAGVLPLSLVQAGGDWLDLALLHAPALVNGKAPAFAPDWKGDPDEASRQRFAVAKPFARDWRVRTAVSEQTRRAADSQLFAYEMACPTADDRLQCTLRFGKGTDAASAQQAAAQLVSLLQALGGAIPGLGKTKAVATVTQVEAQPPVPLPSTGQGPWLVILQSPALMLAPQDYAGAREVQAAYRSALSKLSGGSLTLAHSYTQHEAAGGHYLHKRFRGAQAYQPWLLTSAGSVFALQPTQGQDAQAQATLAQWLQHGLPLPPWLADQGFADCPYRPHEGYGELHLYTAAQRQAAVRPDATHITLLTDWEA